jgi:hypothetical protein
LPHVAPVCNFRDRGDIIAPMDRIAPRVEALCESLGNTENSLLNSASWKAALRR